MKRERRFKMRTIGIDLAVSAAHRAVVMAADGQFVTPVLSFHARWEEIEQLVQRAREGADPDLPLQAVMEPTGMAWFPVAVALQRLGVALYLVNGQRVYDLRRFYKRHSSSDRLSAQVLAKMPLVDQESLHPLEIPSASRLACQRGCKELDRLQGQMTAIKNRLRDIDRFAWPGLEQIFRDIYSPRARFFRRTWYDPAQVVGAGLGRFRASFGTFAGQDQEVDWVERLFQLAIETLQLYGSTALDYILLQQQVCRELDHLAYLEQWADAVWRDTVRPLYRQLHPSRHLETLYGVGEQGAAVYASFIGRAERFSDQRHFRGWHGLIPDSRQSGDVEGKGLHISQAGPDLIKKFGYLNAQIARQYDPQIAAIYYDQMVHKGNHHHQAVCACATHLLDRVYVVLKLDRPYELRDVDHRSLTPEQARATIAQHYTVSPEVRQRSQRRARKARAERRIERQHKPKGSCPRP
jgi:transposase